MRCHSQGNPDLAAGPLKMGVGRNTGLSGQHHHKGVREMRVQVPLEASQAGKWSATGSPEGPAGKIPHFTTMHHGTWALRISI